MIGLHDASSCLTLLVLLTGASFFHTSTTNPITVPGDVPIPHKDTPTGLMTSSAGDGQRKDVGRQSIKKGEPEEEEEELFKDVDPKMLAAVLLGALNSTQAERRREREERGSMEEEGEEDAMKAELEEVREAEAYRQVRRTMEGEDRDRDGRQELELLMATQGRDRERQEEEERKKAQEEEEKMTEKVTSRTSSQTVQVQQTPEQQPPANQDRRGEDQQQRPNEQDGMEEEEEEQLSPEELRSLETMMKEFPRLNTATKREGDSEEQQRRESRGSASSYNDIIPTGKGGDLKKKLKWQEETQKGWNFPSFRGGNFMDDFAVGSNNAGSNAAAAAQSQVVPANEEEDEDEEEEEEEVLSPEEEEAQAKAEQEEMRRQAAEAQKAKMEEEKLADIASDMLLRYMVKQTSGNKKKYGSYNNNNAAEDKRSDEEQEAAISDQDDIDPQTIDKLIEISSKLHLPADDVVDIINDVEKKKKKDVAPEMMSHWQQQQQQQPLTQQTSPSFSSTANKGFSPSRVISTNQNGFPVSNDKPSAATVNLLKTWFQEKSSPPQTTRPQFDLWGKPAKPLQRTNPNPWPIRPQKPLSMQRDYWLKSPKSVWSGYPYTYPSYYQRKPYYPDFYPNTRPNPRYYIHKPALALNNFDDANAFPPRRRYHSWVQPRLRKPPVGRQQSPYYPSYPLPLYPGTYQPYQIPKSRSPPRLPMPMPPQRKQFYYSAGAAPALQRNNGYYAGRQPDSSGNNRDTLEKYIQRILQSPRRFE